MKTIKSPHNFINLTNVKKTALKLTAGVVLVASAYSGIYAVVDKYTTGLPVWLTQLAAAFIVVSFVCVIAQNDTPTKKK